MRVNFVENEGVIRGQFLAVDHFIKVVKQDFSIFSFSLCKGAIFLSHFHDYGLFMVAGESCVDLFY